MPPKKVAEKRKRQEEVPTVSKKAKTAAATGGTVNRPPVDEFYSGKGGKVYVDEADNNTVWAVKLNQTNIGHNNNKFYIIQLIEGGSGSPSRYAVFTRWGRVGENGQHATVEGDLEAMKKAFQSKFSDKTKNKWQDVRLDHSKFKSVAGKYDLVETDNTVSKEELERLAKAIVNKEKSEADTDSAAAHPTKKVHILPSELPKEIQNVISIIMNKETFHRQMKEQNIDANRMPLGKLTKAQVERGYGALEKIEDFLNKKKNTGASDLASLCSAFYTIIPHDFGRSVPPLIDTADKLKKKYDLLNMLNDIQIAMEMEEAAKKNQNKSQTNKKNKKKTSGKEKVEEVWEDNPLDLQYKELQCPLEVVEHNSKEYKVLSQYIDATATSTAYHRKISLLNIYRVDREEDKKRMTEDHRQAKGEHEEHPLLFHGTNVAVIAAILKTGLRIMPHSGGRVGKGLYFASEISKSSGYTQCDPKTKTGFIFLVEVCMGDAIHEIDRDDPSLNTTKVHQTLKSTSTLAQGRQDVDWKDKTVETFKGEFVNAKKKPIAVKVPQKSPQKRKQFEKSTFDQSEYLIYDEGKARIKYLCEFRF